MEIKLRHTKIERPKDLLTKSDIIPAEHLTTQTNISKFRRASDCCRKCIYKPSATNASRKSKTQNNMSQNDKQHKRQKKTLQLRKD